MYDSTRMGMRCGVPPFSFSGFTVNPIYLGHWHSQGTTGGVCKTLEALETNQN